MARTKGNLSKRTLSWVYALRKTKKAFLTSYGVNK